MTSPPATPVSDRTPTAPPPYTQTQVPPRVPPRPAGPRPVRPEAPVTRAGETATSNRRAGWIAAAIAGVVVVAAVVAGVIVLLGRSGGGTDQAGSRSPTPTTQGSSGGSSGPSSSAASSRSSSPSTGRSSVAAATQSYSAPGGLTVRGPAGWTQDGGAHVRTIRDFDAPGDNRDTGTYFRIGIGNTKPLATMQAEADSTEKYLRGADNPYRNVTIEKDDLLTFLGTDAADIEFTGTSKSTGVARHVIERLWIVDGSTRIIQLNAPTGDYDTMRPVFDRLVANAKLG